MIEQRTTRIAALSGAGKNVVVAYLLWWFLGAAGFHRFYLERPKSGLAQLLLLGLGWIPFFIGWIILGFWWLLDAYFVQEYVREFNERHGGYAFGVSLTTGSSATGQGVSALILSGMVKGGYDKHLFVDPSQTRMAQTGLFIGRAQHCDLMLGDASVSREHAHILFENGRIVVRDLGSSNGTFCNDRRLAPGAPRPLNAGDVLRIGKVNLSVSKA